MADFQTYIANMQNNQISGIERVFEFTNKFVIETL